MRTSPRTSRRAGRALAVTAALALAAATTPATSAAITGHQRRTPAGYATQRSACGAPAPRHAVCLALVDTSSHGRALTRAAAAAGLHPYTAADLQAAYKLPSGALGAGQTIAIVDAYDDPNAASDLAAYRKANGLPPCATANGCFRKVAQDGGTNYPPPDTGWALEESLDLDMASAICPNCHLLLVEADNNQDTSLGAAENEAASLGADVISNSYAGAEYPAETALAADYRHPGIAITVASGDGGFGVNVPAAFSTVIAVGGTTLYRSATPRGWTETAWPGAGSGCSAYITKPSWQKDQLCGKRTVADVAAVADPATPVALYDTYGYPGWVAAGGTSVATPVIAGVYALAGNTSVITPGPYLYARHRHLFDITSGSNGHCGGSYLCTARKGYDGPTGWGTPDGTGAF